MSADDLITVPLRWAAHGRTGDKGDRSNISVIAWHPALYPLLLEQVTEQALARLFAARRPARVTRHALPTLHALNLDSHGKTLSFHLMTLPLQVPVALRGCLKIPAVPAAAPSG